MYRPNASLRRRDGTTTSPAAALALDCPCHVVTSCARADTSSSCAGGDDQTAHSLYKLGPRGAFEGAVSSVMGVVKAVPGLSGVVEAEKAKIISEIEDFVLGDNEDTEPHREIPQEGLP